MEASVHCDSLTIYRGSQYTNQYKSQPIQSRTDTQSYHHTTDRQQPVSRLSELRSQQNTAASLPTHNDRKSRLSKLRSQQTNAAS